MTAEGLKLLRAPFPPNQISKLPKPTKKDAPKGRCTECGGWHGLPAVHLDYVGHAALTDRLLDADPNWTWEPLAISPDGLPVLDGYGGMWIKLTVCGVTRLGYGHPDEKTGGNAIKECIGDALRNAAMRFGAALDLWHKGDLHADEEPKDRLIQQLEESVRVAAAAKDTHSPTRLAWESLQPDIQAAFRKAAPSIEGAMPDCDKAIDLIDMALDNWPDEDRNNLKTGLWYLLDSKTRSAIKRHTQVQALKGVPA